MANNTLTVKILSPTQTLFAGQAYSVSSFNSLGRFDILPMHANFITMVQKQPIILRVDRKGEDIQEVKYQFDLAIIFTKDNLVKIYTNIQPQF